MGQGAVKVIYFVSFMLALSFLISYGTEPKNLIVGTWRAENSAVAITFDQKGGVVLTNTDKSRESTTYKFLSEKKLLIDKNTLEIVSISVGHICLYDNSAGRVICFLRQA